MSRHKALAEDFNDGNVVSAGLAPFYIETKDSCRKTRAGH
jgi:hypothetical protein